MPNHYSRIVLAARPDGMPKLTDFRLEAADVPNPGPGQFLVANEILSIDPAIRGFLDDRASYLPPLAIGDTVRAMTMGRVVSSQRADVAVGEIVRSLAGWEEYSLHCEPLGLEVIHAAPGVALEHYMGALGPAGLTAWIGLHAIGQIAAGQTVLVSAAAGAVGSVAGQIARLRNCRVVGLVGSQRKAERLRELGYDVAINYNAERDLTEAIRTACPEGVDIYFDNVGGRVLELMLPLMRLHGRVAVCGMISDYNNQNDPYPNRALWQLVVKRLTLRGFLTYEHTDRLPEARRDLESWLLEGRLQANHTVRDGLDQAPQSFLDLMGGSTMGKTLVRVHEA